MPVRTITRLGIPSRITFNPAVTNSANRPSPPAPIIANQLQKIRSLNQQPNQTGFGANITNPVAGKVYQQTITNTSGNYTTTQTISFTYTQQGNQLVPTITKTSGAITYQTPENAATYATEEGAIQNAQNTYSAYLTKYNNPQYNPTTSFYQGLTAARNALSNVQAQYTNPSKYAPVTVGTFAPNGNLVAGSPITQRVSGNVSGTNQLLGTFVNTPTVKGGAIQFAQTFVPSNVIVSGSGFGVGYAIEETSSYNPTTGQISLNGAKYAGGLPLPNISLKPITQSVQIGDMGIPVATQQIINPATGYSNTNILGFNAQLPGGQTIYSPTILISGSGQSSTYNLNLASGDITLQSASTTLPGGVIETFNPTSNTYSLSAYTTTLQGISGPVNLSLNSTTGKVTESYTTSVASSASIPTPTLTTEPTSPLGTFNSLSSPDLGVNQYKDYTTTNSALNLASFPKQTQITPSTTPIMSVGTGPAYIWNPQATLLSNLVNGGNAYILKPAESAYTQYISPLPNAGASNYTTNIGTPIINAITNATTPTSTLQNNTLYNTARTLGIAGFGQIVNMPAGALTLIGSPATTLATISTGIAGVYLHPTEVLQPSNIGAGIGIVASFGLLYGIGDIVKGPPLKITTPDTTATFMYKSGTTGSDTAIIATKGLSLTEHEPVYSNSYSIYPQGETNLFDFKTGSIGSVKSVAYQLFSTNKAGTQVLVSTTSESDAITATGQNGGEVSSMFNGQGRFTSYLVKSGKIQSVIASGKVDLAPMVVSGSEDTSLIGRTTTTFPQKLISPAFRIGKASINPSEPLFYVETSEMSSGEGILLNKLPGTKEPTFVGITYRATGGFDTVFKTPKLSTASIEITTTESAPTAEEFINTKVPSPTNSEIAKLFKNPPKTDNMIRTPLGPPGSRATSPEPSPLSQIQTSKGNILPTITKQITTGTTQIPSPPSLSYEQITQLTSKVNAATSINQFDPLILSGASSIRAQSVTSTLSQSNNILVKTTPQSTGLVFNQGIGRITAPIQTQRTASAQTRVSIFNQGLSQSIFNPTKTIQTQPTKQTRVTKQTQPTKQTQITYNVTPEGIPPTSVPPFGSPDYSLFGIPHNKKNRQVYKYSNLAKSSLKLGYTPDLANSTLKIHGAKGSKNLFKRTGLNRPIY